MSAVDTLEWYLAGLMHNPSAESREYVKSLREHFFALRSEDERQRFVEQAIEELRRRGIANHHQ